MLSESFSHSPPSAPSPQSLITVSLQPPRKVEVVEKLGPLPLLLFRSVEAHCLPRPTKVTEPAQRTDLTEVTVVEALRPLRMLVSVSVAAD